MNETNSIPNLLDQETSPAKERTIRRTGFFQRAKDFVQVEVVDRTKEAVTTASQKTTTARERLTSRARHLHALSPEDVARATHNKVQRVSAEVAGGLSGAVKALSSGIVGTASGLVTGLFRGLDPETLKRLRTNTEDWQLLGKRATTRPIIEEGRDYPHDFELVLTLNKATRNGAYESLSEPAQTRINRSDCVEDTIVIDDEETPVLLVATHAKRKKTITGLYILEDVKGASNRVWHWYDD